MFHFSPARRLYNFFSEGGGDSLALVIRFCLGQHRGSKLPVSLNCSVNLPVPVMTSCNRGVKCTSRKVNKTKVVRSH